MWLARRILLHERTHMVLFVVSIGLSVMLVIVLLGVLTGVRQQAADYLAHVPGSVAVASSGTENFLMVAVPLSSSTTETVRANRNVARVVPLLSQMVVLQLHERREATFVLGYQPALGGGPRQISPGHAPADDRDIVLGPLLAQRHNISIRDTVTAFGQTFAVTGPADDPCPLMTNFVFVTKPALEELLLAPGASSVLLVTPREGVSPDQLRDQLAELPGTSVLSKQEVIANDVALFTGAIQPVIRLMATIALLAGILVVGLLIYVTTIARRREYGVLKAVGIRNRVLYRAIAAQALIVAVTGAVTGVVLALIAARVIVMLKPEYLIPITGGATLLAAGAGLMMALLAALAPARVIAGLAPADVFRR